jgi:small ligand-binding sensory domain FIST
LLLGDPFTSNAEAITRALDAAYPDAVTAGGLASAGDAPGGNALFLGGDLYREGTVGVGLSGNVCLTTAVAQGCRPIGQPLFVTRCEGNVLLEVDGKPPLEVLNSLFERASEHDRRLFQSSLFIGVEMQPERVEYGQGDFLIRNLIGSDPDKGSLVVGTALEATQVVQFHLRDAATAATDLAERLQRCEAALERAEGALLFSCLGRGRGLYGRPHHDSQLFLERAGPIALGGFFGNGEIGPVEGRTFLHAYTSAFAIFGPRDH